jgi:hypothetical protein
MSGTNPVTSVEAHKVVHVYTNFFDLFRLTNSNFSGIQAG